MLTFSIFLRTILVACQNGAMMETRWSFLIVKLKASIEWNYLDTTPCNHTLIWMKSVHLFLQSTPEPRIASSLQFFPPIGGLIACDQIFWSSRFGLLRRFQMNYCLYPFNFKKLFKQLDILHIFILTTYIRHSCNLDYLCSQIQQCKYKGLEYMYIMQN